VDRIAARLADHPPVRKVLSRKSETPGVIDADWLRRLCVDAGADDIAFARVENPDLASEREHVDAALPGTQSYISLVVKMNRGITALRTGSALAEANLLILNPSTFSAIRRIKNTLGNFLIGDPSVVGARQFLGVPVLLTTRPGCWHRNPHWIPTALGSSPFARV
jgi:hypothetical protein